MTAGIRRQSGRRDADRTGDKQRAAEGEQTAAGRMKSRRESPTEEKRKKRKEPANVEHKAYSVALQIISTLQPFVLFSQAKLKLRFFIPLEVCCELHTRVKESHKDGKKYHLFSVKSHFEQHHINVF